MNKHYEELLASMESKYTNMDSASILRNYTRAEKYASSDVFKLINRINTCKIMVKSCMANFRVGLDNDNAYLCATCHLLFSEFFIQYLEYRNELNMLLSLRKLNSKGGDKDASSNKER